MCAARDYNTIMWNSDGRLVDGISYNNHYVLIGRCYAEINKQYIKFDNIDTEIVNEINFKDLKFIYTFYSNEEKNVRLYDMEKQEEFFEDCCVNCHFGIILMGNDHYFFMTGYSDCCYGLNDIKNFYEWCCNEIKKRKLYIPKKFQIIETIDKRMGDDDLSDYFEEL